MTRRPIQAADVDVDAGGIMHMTAGLTLLETGTATIAATGVPQALVGASTPCALVVLTAPVDGDGVPTNTQLAWAGLTGAGLQVRPIFTTGAEVWMYFDDAADLFLVGTLADEVNYEIYGPGS